jgi:hypothetical protein
MKVYKAIFSTDLHVFTLHYHLIFAKDYSDAYKQAREIGEEPYNKLVSKFKLEDVREFMNLKEFQTKVNKREVIVIN